MGTHITQNVKKLIEERIEDNRYYVSKTADFLLNKIDFTQPLADKKDLVIEEIIYLKNYQILDKELLKTELTKKSKDENAEQFLDKVDQ